MASNKDSREIKREAVHLGMTVKHMRNGHIQITDGLGRRMVIPFSPGTSSRVRQMWIQWNKFKNGEISWPGKTFHKS